MSRLTIVPMPRRTRCVAGIGTVTGKTLISAIFMEASENGTVSGCPEKRTLDKRFYIKYRLAKARPFRAGRLTRWDRRPCHVAQGRQGRTDHEVEGAIHLYAGGARVRG